MSEIWQSDFAGSATRVPAWVRPNDFQPFRPWAMGIASSDSPAMSYADHDPSHVIDASDLQTRAFTEGFEEGRRAVEELVADERAAIAQMFASLESLKPEPSQGLAMLLSETVERLVKQIMGEVAIDRATLAARAQSAAEMIGDLAGTLRLRVNPQDADLLSDAAIAIPIVGDSHLHRGTILLETDEGWIEDGPEARLEQLRRALDKMGLAARDADA
jgi:Flagellar biosynthesis/type III secretory pathway protein